MKTPKTLTAALALIALTACQQVPATDGSSVSTLQAVPETTAAPEAPVAVLPVATPTPTPTATPASTNLTYYSLSATRAPVNGWATKTYTSTGSCVVYQGNTYCWDDGMKTLAWSSGGNNYGPYTYSYWNAGTWGGGQISFNIGGVMETDLMTAPTLVTHNLEINLNSRAAPTTVLSTGTPHAVVCTENSGILNCGAFMIDLNQPHL